MRPQLISFDICPFVQRSVITMQEKGVGFDVTYIDLEDKPPWFLEMSPFGKVPVLKVGETVLFESAVINEYLDETHPPRMLPEDPLARAHNRAWIEFGSALLVDLYRLMVADDAQAFERHRAELQAKLGRLEPQLRDGPYFNGAELSLVDAAYAPLFQRLALIDHYVPLELYEQTPRVRRWSDALLNNASTRTSVNDDFDDAFRRYIRRKGRYLAARL